MHEVLVNHLGGLSLTRKSVIRLTDHPDMTLDVSSGHKTTKQLFIIIESFNSQWMVAASKGPLAHKIYHMEIANCSD